MKTMCSSCWNFPNSASQKGNLMSHIKKQHCDRTTSTSADVTISDQVTGSSDQVTGSSDQVTGNNGEKECQLCQFKGASEDHLVQHIMTAHVDACVKS